MKKTANIKRSPRYTGRKVTETKNNGRRCPRCGAEVSLSTARSYWGKAAGMVSREEAVKVKTNCCAKTLNLDQVRQVRWGNEAAAKQWGRKLAAARKTFGAGPGRPTVMKPCPKCQQKFTARELRRHKPHCTGAPDGSA